MLVIVAAAIASVTNPLLPPDDDRQMIAEAQAIVRTNGDRVWEGFSQAPLPILLIGPDQETLFCGAPAPDFSPAGFDSVTNCAMQTRPRELPVDLSAATYIGDQQVIMVGVPDALGMSRDEWIVTILHEAFHQYQSTLPGYIAAVDRVREMFGGDSSQWMLDYPFPYADSEVENAFKEMTGSALRYLEATSSFERHLATSDYIDARKDAKRAASLKDWAYFEFQAGQEGVARWSEQELGALVATSHPSIAAVAEDGRLGLAASLRAIDRDGLGMWKRSAFYVLGAIEAEMLHQLDPAWQRQYVNAPFSLGTMIERTAEQLQPR
ncbi:hypothetical protein [Croceicoccus hydrothermalis]|uniref:hypothetical protein n=1 Tax=Croceicoccus hydrothermalis TaxID=2867964 RepID=UPI001EFB82FD|nr:hypothetical protein [Croceicoccus hydrothermalis]